jgi:hypothetical protein
MSARDKKRREVNNMLVLQAILWGLVLIPIACLVLPIVGVILFIVYTWIAPVLPILLVALVIWGVVKLKKSMKPCVVPSNAKPAQPKIPRKPIMVKWHGESIPLAVFIIGIILSAVLALLLIVVMLVWIPIWIDILIIVGFVYYSKKKSK